MGLSLCRVSKKVVDFYKALAAKEAPCVGKYDFPDIEFDIPPEEGMVGQRPVKNFLTNKFEEVPQNVFTEIVTCYHCRKKGHPAFACKSGPMHIINAQPPRDVLSNAHKKQRRI